MIPHFKTPFEVVVSVSPCGTYVLVGTCAKHLIAASVYELTRYRWTGEGFVASRPVALAGASVSGALPQAYFEGPRWIEHLSTEPVALVLTPLERFARVHLPDVKRFAQRAAKAGGEDELIAVHVHTHRVVLCSLGPLALRKSFDLQDHVPNAGLGACVVYAPALKRLIVETKAGDLAVAFTGRDHRKVLRLGGRELWTVAREGPDVEGPREFKRYPIAAALRRALPFASTDKARENLNRVSVSFDDGHLTVSSTNGHSAHREVVPFEGARTRPSIAISAALVTAAAGKRGEDVPIAVEGADAYLCLADGTELCVSGGSPSPPLDSLFSVPEPHATAVLDDAGLASFCASIAGRGYVRLTGPHSATCSEEPTSHRFNLAKLEALFSGFTAPVTIRLASEDARAPIYVTANNQERLLCPLSPE